MIAVSNWAPTRFW